MAEHHSKAADRPLHELLSRDMVDMYVGPENTHWILHEKLLCARSSHFRQILSEPSGAPSSSKSFDLPDDDDDAFRAFVGWLYSEAVPPPKQEADLGICFELYLMGERWRVDKLRHDVLSVVRTWYWETKTYPGLRRVQYVYANTEEGSPMRSLLVSSVARMLVLGRDGLPKHWDKALRKNGQLAVDIITMVQRWRLNEDMIPDDRNPDEKVKAFQTPKSEDKTAAAQKELLDKELPNGLLSTELSSGDSSEGISNGVRGDLPSDLTHRLPNGIHKALPNGLGDGGMMNGVAVH